MTNNEMARLDLVQDWAKSKNMDNVELLGNFNGSNIFRRALPEHFKHKKIGFPVYIIDDGTEIRFCRSAEETFEIMDYFRNEKQSG